MGQQNFSVINLDGGLNLVDTHYTLQETVGTCKIMDNFESTIEGGYRRIDGYTKFGTTQPTGDSDTVYGVFPYADGIVAIASTGVYFSVNGNTWVQVNRDTYTALGGTVQVTNTSGTYIDVVGTSTSFTSDFIVGDHIRIDGNIREIAAIASDTSITLTVEINSGVSAGTTYYKNGASSLSGTITPRTDQGVSEFAWLESDGIYGSIVIVDTTGNNDACRFKVEGSGGSRTYYFDTLTSDFSAPPKPRHCVGFQQRVIFGDVYEEDIRETGSVAWSDRYQNLRFDGASAGALQVDSPVVALKPFRDRLIVFCRNSIYQVTNLNDPNQLNVRPVSYNTGCASAQSIQEIGGDVIFLSYDGIRTLSATNDYGDIAFGIISTKIDPYIKTIINNISSYTVSSCIIRNKNQYRLYYTSDSNDSDQQLGVIGTLKRSRQGIMDWQWSRVKGIPVACLSSAANPFLTTSTKEERIFHGGYDGYIYQHDTGNSFDGSNISAEFELNELDYGDAGLKKTLHYIRTFGRTEGGTDGINVGVKFDFNSNRTMQPGTYIIEFAQDLARYGTAVYGTDVYGGGSLFNEQINLEGSGFSNNFTFTTSGTGSPFIIDSLYVDVRLGAKQ